MLSLRGDGAPSMYVFRLTFFRSPRPVYALVYSLDCRTHVFTVCVCALLVTKTCFHISVFSIQFTMLLRAHACICAARPQLLTIFDVVCVACCLS